MNTTNSRLLALLFSFSLAATARAQDGEAPPETSPASADETAAATAEAAAEETDPELAEAMERYGDAVALFDRSDFRGALVEMQRVLELLEGHDNQYVVLYDLGRVYEELHRYDLALVSYQRYLDESPEGSEDRANAEASLRALERLVGTVTIHVDVPEAEVWIGEWQVGTAPGDILVPAGVHQLELRAEGHETVRRQIELTARSTITVDASLPLLSDFHGVDPALFIASTATAVVAAAVGFALGGVAMSLSNDSAACIRTAGCVIANPDGRRREISDFTLGADILFGTAGLFAITSVVLAVLTDWGGRPAAPADTTAFRLVPWGGQDGGGATATWEF